jgi:hypothetical protein
MKKLPAIPSRREDRKITLPKAAGIPAVLPKCRRAYPGDPTQLHDFPLLVDGRPSVT